MEYLLFMIIGILLFIILLLCIKVYFLRRASREISDAFHNSLTEDTNALITVSTGDACMKKLAADINIQLGLLKKKRNLYQQGNLELKEAVTNISHDLRTPLTAISGYLDLLDPEEKSPKVQHYISQIQNRAKVLKDLTEELFQYSIVTSLDCLITKDVDLVRTLEESLLSFYAVMQAKGIQPQICLPETPVWRKLDTVALNRIFSNIISNALKYSEDSFTVEMKPSGCISFTNPAPNLNPVTVGKLFHRFYTVESSQNSTGLGLSIAKILTERMGGTIEADYVRGYLQIKVRFPSRNQ
nr:HAMP domain-containing sensor histidine kinase [uncultured Blautia sp.]